MIFGNNQDVGTLKGLWPSPAKLILQGHFNPRMWNVHVHIVSLVIGCLGFVSTCLVKYLKLYITIQWFLSYRSASY